MLMGAANAWDMADFLEAHVLTRTVVVEKSQDHSSLLSITLLLCYPTLSIAIKIKSKRNEIACCIEIR